LKPDGENYKGYIGFRGKLGITGEIEFRGLRLAITGLRVILVITG